MKKNIQLLILVGAPGSGKTTFAKYFIRTEENWMRVCRDDFRMMHFTSSNMPPREESLITEMVDAAIETLLNKKCNVLIDATHCRAEYMEHYIKKFNHLADIKFKVFDVEAEELANRCQNRYEETGKLIPSNVQKRYFQEFNKLKESFDFSPRPKVDRREKRTEQNKDLPKALICDLDGTLALIDHRNPFDASRASEDELNEPVANTLRLFAKEGYQILLVSGREDKFREATVTFLEKYSVPYHQLWMRKTKDFRKDSIVKREIFDAEIANKYYIEFVLDDRNQVIDMWRKGLNLACFQVNYGDF